jgi:hypothetical protein
MRQKRKAQFQMDVAEAARKTPRMPRGRPSPQNLTAAGRANGLEAMLRAPRCRTQRRNGERCRNAAMRGASRCLKHGGRAEVPAHPYNVRRFLSGEMTRADEESQQYTRRRQAWDRMSHREQREFLAMLPPEVAKKSSLVIYAAEVWSQIQDEGYPAWRRLLEDLRARIMGPG